MTDLTDHAKNLLARALCGRVPGLPAAVWAGLGTGGADATGLIVTVPAAVTCAGWDSVDQVSGLPPVAASNRPTWLSVPAAVVKAKLSAWTLRCAPAPVKVTRWRA